MRVLLTTRGSSGHVLPLAPFGHACLRAGHEVLVAAQSQHRANVERAGLACWPTADPPAEQWMAQMARFGRLGIEQANAQMIGESSPASTRASRCRGCARSSRTGALT